MHADEIVTAKGAEANEMSARNIAWQVLLVLVPWLVFWLMEESYARLMVSLFGDVRVPSFLALAPIHVLLITGVIVAWKRKFPAWSYTWIGTLYFFAYRDIFQVVIMSAHRMVPYNPDLIINGFYLIVNPLALAFLLALITRRDWLLACFTAYPYTSIIQAWYTLDWANTPRHILVTSLVLYGLFASLFIVLESRRLKFVSLLAGTLLIGVGFYLYRWDVLVGGMRGFLQMSGRLLAIILFPLLIHRIPLYRTLFRCGQPASVVGADEDGKTI
jgi:hypothetical protein